MGSSAVTKIGGSGGGSKITVNQSNSFVAGDVLRYDASSSLYAKALATTPELAEAIGIVESRTPTNFVLVLGGKIDTSDFTVENESAGTATIAGDVYFLSESVAGKLTQTAPTATGTIRKAMLTQTTADGVGYVTNYIGIQNGIGTTDLVDISEVQPVGTIVPFAGDVSQVPNGFLLCDGSEFSASSFPELANVVGDKYQSSSGDTYYLPDLRGKFALGNNPQGDGGDPGFTRRTEGDAGGSETHVLQTTELPSHNHSATYNAYQDDAVPNNAGDGGTVYNSAEAWIAAGRPQVYDILGDTTDTNDMGGGANATVIDIGNGGPIISNDWSQHTNTSTSDKDYLLLPQDVSVGNRGNNAPHNNIPPFLSVNFIIKASPNANAAILTTGFKQLSDVDLSRGATAGTDNVQNGDMLVYNSAATSFVAKPYDSENFLRNGACRFWQRGTSFFDTVTAYTGIPNSQYTADGFFYRRTGGSAFKVIRGSENAVIPLSIATAGMDFVPARRNLANDGTQNATETLEVQRTFLSGFQPGAQEQHTLEMQVEGYDFARLVSCDYMTLSFYAYTAATDFNTGGRTIGVSFRNKSNGRSYVTSFVPSVGAWSKYTISVPLADIFTSADIGNWSFDHTVGLSITFALSAGSAFRVASGSENSWVTGNFIATQSQYDLTNASNTTNTTSLGLALLKLEAGAYATRFTAEPWETAMQRNRRHFQKSYELYQVPGTALGDNYGVVVDDPVVSNTIHAGIQFPVQMRGTPTVRIYNPQNGTIDQIRSFHGEGSPTTRTVSTVRTDSAKIRWITLSSSLPTDDRRRMSFEYTADAELLNPTSSSENVT